MEKSPLRYLPTALLLIALAGSTYLSYGFASAGIFTSGTLTMLIAGTLALLISTVISSPTVENIFKEKVSDSKLAYWAFVGSLLLIAGILLLQGVLSGGVDYSNAVANNSTG